MNVTAEAIDLPHLRIRVFTPARPGRWPAVLAWSDIFQHTSPHVRMCTRLAAHGYTVLTPELYGRFEPPGAVLHFENDRHRALEDAGKMSLSWFDEDLAATMDFARTHTTVDPTQLFACGWCIGGHLAFRAAMHPDVRATACFYATGLHSNTLGGAIGTAPSLAEATRIQGELLMIWGSRDPHIPADGRQHIHAELARAGTRFHTRTWDAEHTFMRDEGARWEPVAADEAFASALALFRAHAS